MNKLKKIKKRELKIFLLIGIFNFLLTNIILQALLLIINTILATFISQTFNFIVGFNLYGQKVFNMKTLKLSFFVKYLALSIFIWNINWILIFFLNSYGLSKNIASLFIIPLLVMISFLFQKFFVFI